MQGTKLIVSRQRRRLEVEELGEEGGRMRMRCIKSMVDSMQSE